MFWPSPLCDEHRFREGSFVWIEQVPDRIIERAPLGAFVVLNWRRDSDQPTELQRVDLEERQDLLSAIMKSPGPFYQDLQGRFLSDQEPLEPRPYQEGLAGVPIYEAKGRLDFAALIPQCLEVL